MWLSPLRSKAAFSAALFCGLILTGGADGQTGPVRRAQPVTDPPVPRAVPVDQPPPAPPPPGARPAPPPPNNAPEGPSQPAPEAGAEGEPGDRRQLDYATALYGRKLYDLAAPEFEKYLDRYPDAPGRAQAQF